MAMLYFTAAHAATAGDLLNEVRDALGTDAVIGCSCRSLIGRTRAIEEGPAASVVAAHLPGTKVRPFVLDFEDWRAALSSRDRLGDAVGAPLDTRLFTLLADPFSVPTTPLLEALDARYPGVPAVGGMADGAAAPGEAVLLCGDRIVRGGAVGLAFSGELSVDVIVSQGCRPIGPLFEVTAASRNLLIGLSGSSPLQRLQEILARVEPEERRLLRGGLFVGRAVGPGEDPPGRGDFLIRNVLGVDEESGIMAISDLLREGETLQFHVRDAGTASEDLAMLLSPQSLQRPPAGGLVFSCNGRGSRFFGRPNADVSTIRGLLGDLEMAGFSCAGEIGPIGGRNSVHGHTVSMAIFR
jgi:small ligand-binding sensory domain FIST